MENLPYVGNLKKKSHIMVQYEVKKQITSNTGFKRWEWFLWEGS